MVLQYLKTVIKFLNFAKWNIHRASVFAQFSVEQWLFRKTGTTETPSSRAEIGVWVQAPGTLLQGSRDITPGKNLRRSPTKWPLVSNSIKETHGRTDGRRHVSASPSVRSFVSLSVVSVRGVHPVGERTAMLYRNLRWRNKNPGSTNKYTKFCKLISRKIIKIIASILRLKWTKFYFRPLSIRPSVRSFLTRSTSRSDLRRGVTAAIVPSSSWTLLVRFVRSSLRCSLTLTLQME